ncbi:MAG: type IIL restriction-modification enzyme MmeI, partial [Roseiflexaceae bacterium]|nr:type IIL restriction-modification enzyme MmeI [Roseiflexaceae bacterium]
MTDIAATAAAFVAKWQQNAQKESAAAKEHFIDLCHLLGLATPNDPGSGPETYCFEKSLTKVGGSAGFADVWKRDAFAWEYKGKGKYADLRAAYQQLLLYKEDLGNPPILVACDIATYEVHIAYTGYPTRVERFTNADLQNVATRELLRLVFTEPERLRPVERTSTITEKAAGRFGEVARFLEQRGYAPIEIAHFFMKLLFALFAEDIQLLPAELMSKSLRQAITNPAEFPGRARALFRSMREGGYFGMDRVPQFNGWLFNDDAVLALNPDELQFLVDAARLDWSAVEPAIFGTLFERSLDPSKRAQLGAHYTSRADILLIVEPVLMAPLRRAWAEVQVGTEALRQQWESAGLSANQRRRLQGIADGMLLDFLEQLARVRVLDPACGSGNFLYVALTELKNLEKEVWAYAGGLGLQQPELSVSPAQLYGIEKNPFAAELAQVVVWIGYLQWLRNNGFLEGTPKEPILQTLYNIECRDAILTVDLNGQPAEPHWPAADVIIGNPPFLGGSKLRRELGDTYTESLWSLYTGRVPGGADLVTYWFERARDLISSGITQRAGLIATQSIRAGSSRKVLERIKETGDIFMAWSDRPWVLDGAAVRVSMVGFDSGDETTKLLNGESTSDINDNLTSELNVTKARHLSENANIAFQGPSKKGPFEISVDVAQKMLAVDANTNGRPNSDVVRPWANGSDITGRSREMWIIDFGVGLTEQNASHYMLPFQYIKDHVYPVRSLNRRAAYAEKWWQHAEARPGMRKALQGKSRYIVTPRVAKHRLFIWLEANTLADDRTFVFARDDDYFFGVLHSHLHEVWSLATSSRHGDGDDGGRPTYNNTTCFETFPFPWSPGTEDHSNPLVQAIAQAARNLVALRDAWLNPSESESVHSPLPGVGEGLGVR